MKMLGFVLVIACTSAIGLYAAYRLKLRVKFLEEFIYFISSMETQIRYNAGDLSSLIDGDYGRMVSQLLENCRTYLNEGQNFKDAWIDAVDNLPKEYCLSDNEKEMVRDFGTGLGTTDTQGQLAHCELYLTAFKNKLESARCDHKEKGRIYTVLGTSLGVCVALLIL